MLVYWRVTLGVGTVPSFGAWFSILEIETDDFLFVDEIQFFSSLTTIIPELNTHN